MPGYTKSSSFSRNRSGCHNTSVLLCTYITSGSWAPSVRYMDIIVTFTSGCFWEMREVISVLAAPRHCQVAFTQGQDSPEHWILCSTALPWVRQGANNQISVHWWLVFLRTCPKRLRSKDLTTVLGAWGAKSSSTLQYFWCNWSANLLNGDNHACS